MEITGHSLYNVWRGVNMSFINMNCEGLFLPRRDYAIFGTDVILRCNSLTLPQGVSPLFNVEKRIKLLTRKYINKDLWEAGVQGLRTMKYRENTSTGLFPKSFQLQFQLSNPNLETGKGGGCLIGLVLSWVRGKWNLHIYSRVSEITINLLADMYFVQSLIRKLVYEGDLKKIEFPILNTTWNLALVNQKRDRVPIFLLFNYGDAFVRDFMFSKLTNPWQKRIIDHFWKVFIYPEKVNWAQRKRWSLKFLELSQKDWKMVKAINESKNY